jgi:hypothetical protein
MLDDFHNSFPLRLIPLGQVREDVGVGTPNNREIQLPRHFACTEKIIIGIAKYQTGGVKL